MKKAKFLVTGMTCASCQAHVQKAVSKLDGVRNVNVNLLDGSMTLDYDESKTDSNQITSAVSAAGYGATAESAGEKTESPKTPPDDSARLFRQFFFSLFFLLPLFYIAMSPMFGWPLFAVLAGIRNAVANALVQLFLTVCVLYLNRSYFRAGFKSLFHFSPNMDSLVALGSGAGAVYGVFVLFQMGAAFGQSDWAAVDRCRHDLYFDASAMILVLITLGKYFEARTRRRTGDAIAKLVKLVPDTACVERDGKEMEIPVSQIVRGDIVVIKQGNSIPVDGVVTEGTGVVNQSAITGESLPVEKKAGDGVVSSSLNTSGFFKFRAEKVGADTTLARIVELVREAGSSKAPISRLADTVSLYFVPVVILIALVTGAVWLWNGYSFYFAMSSAIAVLVISCPCALGLAMPVAVMAGTGRAASRGILFRNAEALETLSKVKTVLFDKTGTLTKGEPVVFDVAAAEGTDPKELLKLAAALEKRSDHPLARAVVARAEKDFSEIPEATGFRNLPGRGVQAEVNGVPYSAGNDSLMTFIGAADDTMRTAAQTSARKGFTPIYLASKNKILGVLLISDEIKPSSAETVRSLKAMGLQTVMLTGDNNRTASTVASALGIDHVAADILPEDKERIVREWKEHGKVAMVGDGVNDAPALVRADVGIAIGSGTDIAIDSADVVLMNNSPAEVVTAIQLSRAVLKNIKINLFWAFFYNAAGIPLAAGVFYTLWGLKLSPVFGAAAMSMSSVCVVLNALRLRYFKLDRSSAPS